MATTLTDMLNKHREYLDAQYRAGIRSIEDAFRVAEAKHPEHLRIMVTTLTDMLNKHREYLDAQYRAGIRTIEDAFRVAEAKDPEQFRKLTEELWRHSFECPKTTIETQMRDLQAVAEKGFEAVFKGATGAKL